MIVSIALALLASLQAPEADPEIDCGNALAQMEMNLCALQDFERADAELNAAYREAIAGQREGDREIDRDFDRRPTGEQTLREAQRAWVAFRDAHCTLESYNEARGGSMEPMVFDGCRATLTRERTAQLRAQPVDD